MVGCKSQITLPMQFSKFMRKETENGTKLLRMVLVRFKTFAIKNTSLGATRCNYPLKEVRTSHVSFSGLLGKKYIDPPDYPRFRGAEPRGSYHQEGTFMYTVYIAYITSSIIVYPQSTLC